MRKMDTSDVGVGVNCARIIGFHYIGVSVERKADSPNCRKHLETKIVDGALREDSGSLQAAGHRFDPGHVHHIFTDCKELSSLISAPIPLLFVHTVHELCTNVEIREDSSYSRLKTSEHFTDQSTLHGRLFHAS
jgi:hypothetical protein